MSPRQGTARLRQRVAIAASAAACWATLAVAPAFAETAVPSVAAQIAHAEFLPYMEPPPGEPATVCLVDTGVDMNPDTESTVVGRVALDGGDPGDVWDRKHGTEMAMVMGAPMNGWGTVGAWPYVRIVSVRAMPPGATSFPFNYYARSIVECLKRPSVRVVNLSFSGPRPSDSDIREFSAYAAGARRNGVSIVAGAGNGGSSVEWPAAEPGVFAVAAARADHTPCAFSARGPQVALAAPGCDLALADPVAGEPISYAGTSPAAAFASSILAALRSYRPDFSAAQAEDMLRSTTVDGVLDAEAAFRAAALGDAVDLAKARIPSPPTQGGKSTPSPASPTEPESLAWPELRLTFGPGRAPRWPTPRLRSRRCTPYAVVVRLANRPHLARVVVRRYTRIGEFRERLVGRQDVRASRVRSDRDFDYMTMQYAGRGRLSSVVRVPTCRSGH